jgi:hypothetical protein
MYRFWPSAVVAKITSWAFEAFDDVAVVIFVVVAVVEIIVGASLVLILTNKTISTAKMVSKMIKRRDFFILL